MNAVEDLNDYSSTFHVVKNDLKNPIGTSYKSFISDLTPNYQKVRSDIALGYAALLLTMAIIFLIPANGIMFVGVITVLGAISVGFWVAYIQLFIHEAAHFNIAPNKTQNDRLANWFIGIFVGSSIADYRKVHFKHHGALGTVEDSENSYFFPLNILMIFKMFFGIRVLEVLMRRKEITSDAAKKHDSPKASGVFWGGILLHLCIVGICIWAGSIAGLLSWVLGIAIFFPFFGAIRQVLEHRSEHASTSVDYTQVDHGAMTRIFGQDLFSRTFGAAGFNAHLIHHWEPTVSYTNFDQVMEFLQTTEMAPILDQRKSSYWTVAKSLILNGK